MANITPAAWLPSGSGVVFGNEQLHLNESKTKQRGGFTEDSLSCVWGWATAFQHLQGPSHKEDPSGCCLQFNQHSLFYNFLLIPHHMLLLWKDALHIYTEVAFLSLWFHLLRQVRDFQLFHFYFSVWSSHWHKNFYNPPHTLRFGNKNTA